MKSYLDWSAYKDSGMGDAYADIPKTGGDFAKAVAVCIKSGLGESAERVAANAILFEEFIAKELQANRFQLQFSPLEQEVLVHGHCHQKAVGAMKSMRKVLKLIPKLKFELVESSCCGMAGSFGIEKEHTEMAMQMAEQSLLPTLRQNPTATVVANGFSCQHQIREGCDHQPIHIAQLLRDAMIRPGVTQ